MARRPAARRPGIQEREENALQIADGFAAPPDVQRARQQAVLDANADAARRQFDALMNSDLRDRITDEQAEQAALEDRISDTFGYVFDHLVLRSGHNRISDPVNHRAPPQMQMLLQHNAPARQAQQVIAQLENRAGDQQAQGNVRGGNLPALRANNQQLTTELQHLEAAPTWLHLRRAPAYILTQVRALGRELFGMFTETPIEDMSVILSGLHSTERMMGTANWIRNNGEEIRRENIDISERMAGYTAQASCWQVGPMRFLIVRDQHAQYIYGWPEIPRNDLRIAPRQQNLLPGR